MSEQIVDDYAVKSINELIQELPPDLMEEVRNFIEFLLSKQQIREKRPLGQNWAGALKEYREQYSSLELERKALAWRDD